MIDYKKQAATKARIKSERLERKMRPFIKALMEECRDSVSAAFQDALIFGVGKIRITEDGPEHIPYGSDEEE